MQRALHMYCEQMNQVRLRLSMLEQYVKMANVAPGELQLIVSIEAAALDLRLTLEHIAFSSLVANREEYARAYENFEKHYHAKYILKDVERQNSEFYPWPVSIQRNAEGSHISPLQGDYLTREEFEKAYDKCGSQLHARNPFGAPIDYPAVLKSIERWGQQLRVLLREHIVQIAGFSGFILVSMTDESTSTRAHHLVTTDGGEFVKG